MRLRAIIARRTRPRQTRQAADSDTRAQFHYPETTRKSPPGHLGSVRARPALVLLLIAIQIPSQMRQVFQTRTNPPAGSGCCGVSALRMINLDVPQTALAGDTIKLSCFYSLTADGDEVGTAADRTRANLSDPTAPGPRPSEMLYAVKWYKEDKEFFRYLAQEWPHKQALPLVGVQVDVHKSDNRSVVLKSVSLHTSGLYKCEVSTDAPNFITKSIEHKLSVYSLPSGGPQIRASHYRKGPNLGDMDSSQRSNLRWTSIGERIELQCDAPETKPATRIDWVINETLNLSAFAPIDSRGRQLFGVSSHRYTKLPLQLSSNQMVEPGLPRSNQRHQHSTTETKHPGLSASGSGQSASAISRLSQSPLVGALYADFELIEQKDPGEIKGGGRNQGTPVRAVPKMQLATLPSPLGNLVLPTITLAPRTLDQLLERSSSTLNFTIDSDLMQLLFAADKGKVNQTSALLSPNVDTDLRETSNLQRPPSPETLLASDSRGKRQSLGHNSTHIELQSSANSHRPTNVAPYRRRSGSGYIRGDSGSASNHAVIHIKCVARVLNLNMFDEIRLVLQSKSTIRQDRLVKSTSSRPVLSATRRQFDYDKSGASAPVPNMLRFVWVVTLAIAML